jgi:ribonuclease R
VLTGGAPRRDDAAREKLSEAALASSVAERRAMEVERAIVDLYRTFLMKDRIGERFEGTVTAVVGSGLFVQLDSPFVDVLVRLEDLGQDRWEVDDDTLRVATRSGEAIGLGDRMMIEVTDAAILRRTVYARRAGAGVGARNGADGGKRPMRHADSKNKGAKPFSAKGQARPMSRADQLKLLRAGRKSKKVNGGGPKPGKKGGSSRKK